jgi:hypothetical protein
MVTSKNTFRQRFPSKLQVEVLSDIDRGFGFQKYHSYIIISPECMGHTIELPRT